MKNNELSFMIGGYAGQGVKTIADIFARMCSRAGLYVFVNLEYPSNIKGEHNYIQIIVSENQAGSLSTQVDLLLALDAKTINLHKDEIIPGGALIYDRENLEVSHIDGGLNVEDIDRDDILIIDIPFNKIAGDVGGTKKMINSIGLGAVQGLLGFDIELLVSILRNSFSRFNDKTIEANLEGAGRAYSMVREKYSEQFGIVLEKRDVQDRMLLTGNEAVAMGAIKAGLKFYSGYPMTPASPVMNYVSKRARDYDIVTILTEDEISAAGMALGAAFAGVRSMTGTSGGGFCLMSEFFGLAGMTETPLVILEGQRPGPATGLPTRTEQADLKFVLSVHQGDFPRIVIAPGSPLEAFYLTFDAFNLAERYQTPVIILTDKHVGESYWTYEPFNVEGMEINRGELIGEEELKDIKNYKRYLITDSGISPRTIPGTPGGVFKATGNEHNEYGFISEDADNRTEQMNKRLRKLSSLDVSEIGVKFYGDPDADITLVGWGSTKSVILEAMSLLEKNNGLNCNFLQIIYMEPFPAERVNEILRAAKKAILIENNATGQLGDIITQKTGFSMENRILKYNGRQFFRNELAEIIENSF